MSNRKYIDPSQFTDYMGARDLQSNSIRKTTFKIKMNHKQQFTRLASEYLNKKTRWLKIMIIITTNNQFNNPIFTRWTIVQQHAKLVVVIAQ